jgi:hypothetical protein
VFGWEAKENRVVLFLLNASAPQKQPEVSALSDASALLPLLPSTLIWLSNQTENGTAPLYSTLQPNKKIERLCYVCQTRNRTILFSKTRMEPFHSSWFSNQTHPNCTGWIRKQKQWNETLYWDMMFHSSSNLMWCSWKQGRETPVENSLISLLLQVCSPFVC